jgi:excinuclease ABC subunit A
MILAPLVVGRKGEQAELFDELRAQGSCGCASTAWCTRSTSSPSSTATASTPSRSSSTGLKVMDRSIQQRLAESFETALRHADGRALAVEMGEGDKAAAGKEHLFSSKFACPVCSFSIPELEPRLFSFNNPMGACPALRRPGRDHVLRPQARRRLPAPVARGRAHPRMGPAQPVLLLDAELACPALRLRRRVALRGAGRAGAAIVLSGSGDEKGAVPLPGRARAQRREGASLRGNPPEPRAPLPETDSVAVKEELAKYLNTRACPECDGTGLRVEARYVRGRRAATSTSSRRCRCARRSPFFERLELPGAKQAIAEKIVREIANRVQFLNNVGLDYLSLTRSADTLSGGEAQRIRLASQIGSGSRASCTCWTSRPSGCTSATTRASSRPSSACATSATR